MDRLISITLALSCTLACASEQPTKRVHKHLRSTELTTRARAAEELPPPRAEPAPETNGHPRLGDGVIAQLVITASEGDVRIARAALPRLRSEPARAHAERTIMELALAARDTRSIASDTYESKESLALERDIAAALDAIAHADDVDAAFADAMRTAHERELALLDERLIPSAQNATLKALLADTRAIVADHLERARRLR